MISLWQSLSANQQDALIALALLSPLVAMGFGLCRGFEPTPLIRALLKRFFWPNLLFIILIGSSVGIGVGLLSQERGLRQGSAQAANKFDLIVAAPGSEITTLLASVYLQATDLPLLGGDIYSEVETHPNVALASPLAFGDSWQGAPIVGTTAQFASHLVGDKINGRLWFRTNEALAGSNVALSIGDTFEPSHGRGDAAVEGSHAGIKIQIVGTLAKTGSPWDDAILVPVEDVWSVHGLSNGHAPERATQIGPPFDADYFPGTPAIVVKATSLGATYSLRAEFTRDLESMAFFPGAVLNQLHRLMGDISQAMTLLARVTQILVTLAVLLALFILTRLFQPQMAVLRALGAPNRFVLAVVWGYATTLLTLGALLGVGLGLLASFVLAQIVSAQTGISIPTSFAWRDVHLIAGFLAVASIVSLLPALASLRASVVDALRR